MRKLLSIVLAVAMALSLSAFAPASAALADPGQGNAGDFRVRNCEVTVGGLEFEVNAAGEVEVEIAPGIELELDELVLSPFLGLRELRILRAAEIAVAVCGARVFDLEDLDLEDLDLEDLDLEDLDLEDLRDLLEDREDDRD